MSKQSDKDKITALYCRLSRDDENKAYRAQSKIKQKFYNNTLPKTVSKILAFS